MRKLLLASMSLLTVVTLLAGCAPATPTGPECKWKIGLVTDVGEIDDKSFNEAAWIGVQEGAKELGLAEECIGYIETQDAKDYHSNLESFIDEGYGILVTSGFAMGEATNEMAKKKIEQQINHL